MSGANPIPLLDPPRVERMSIDLSQTVAVRLRWQHRSMARRGRAMRAKPQCRWNPTGKGGADFG
ncbi:MAG: hypothetical protein JWP99_795 [Devosia sp.]|nr:hypothetical protein [Devosia sp.]